MRNKAAKADVNANLTTKETAALADEMQTAEYIFELTAQLERLARMHGLVSLAFKLGGCREEAANIAAGRISG